MQRIRKPTWWQWSTKVKTVGIIVFHLAMSLYCAWLLTIGIQIILAQGDSRVSLLQYQSDYNTRRLDEIEKLNIDRRLALIEQAIQDIRANSTIGGLGLIGVASLIAERLYSFAKNREKKRED